MNLYIIERKDKMPDYDEYCRALVAAKSEIEACKIDPSGPDRNGHIFITGENGFMLLSTWTNNPANVKARYVGKAAKDISRGVVMADFMAG